MQQTYPELGQIFMMVDEGYAGEDVVILGPIRERARAVPAVLSAEQAERLKREAEGYWCVEYVCSYFRTDHDDASYELLLLSKSKAMGTALWWTGNVGFSAL